MSNQEALRGDKEYKTIVISDIHLGAKWSSVNEATAFIKSHSCETLILCGDIIDGWAIMRSSKQRWTSQHSAFVKAILDIAHSTKIVYIKGNHDDFLERLIPIQFTNIEVVNDIIYESCGKRFLVLHGDLFDNVTASARWLSKLGDIGYTLLLTINKFYNFRREKLGLPYVSFASKVKQRVKKSVSQMSAFEENLAKLARSMKCTGIICGHIHHPEIKVIDGIDYLNAGDWIESLSALTESYSGEWSLIYAKPENKE